MISAKLIIEHGEITKQLNLKSNIPFQFLDILNEISNLCPDIDNNAKLAFYLCKSLDSLNDVELICDLTRFVKHEDHIFLRIYRDMPYFALKDVKNNSFLLSSYDIKELYNFYIQNMIYLSQTLNSELLIYEINGTNHNLIDVLDNPDRHLNECINRMVKCYNF